MSKTSTSAFDMEGIAVFPASIVYKTESCRLYAGLSNDWKMDDSSLKVYPI